MLRYWLPRHLRFGGPDMKRLVAGRERIYLDRLGNDFSADPKSFSEVACEHDARLYPQPGAMRAAFDQDAIDNKVLLLLIPGLLLANSLCLGTANRLPDGD